MNKSRVMNSKTKKIRKQKELAKSSEKGIDRWKERGEKGKK